MLTRAQRASTPRGGALLGPPAVQVAADHLRGGERVERTFAVIGYPREVSRGWLAPLLQAAGGA